MSIRAGIHQGGRLNKFADGAIATRYLLGKAGSDANHVVATTNADKPIFLITDEAHNAGDPIGVVAMGCSDTTLRVAINTAVTAGDPLIPDVNGFAKTGTGNGAGSWVIGYALETGVAGDQIEFMPDISVQSL